MVDTGLNLVAWGNEAAITLDACQLFSVGNVTLTDSSVWKYFFIFYFLVGGWRVAKTCHVFFTFVTWFCRHLEDSSWCSPSGRGQRRRFCRLFGRSWHFQSWWHHFLDTAGRWGSPRRTALAVLSQTAGQLDWTLKGEETRSSMSANRKYF